MMKITYLDYAATTPVSKEVFAAMKPYFSQKYGNPSEFHELGTQARRAIEESRLVVADFLGAKREEIIFTGSASESINLALKGLVESLSNTIKKPHIITSSIEHKAVLECAKHLENSGMAEVTCLPVDKYGQVAIEDVKKAIRPNTVLVSIMYVNNEVGTIQPIAEIGHLLKKINLQPTTYNLPPTTHIHFHTDATQGIQYLDCNVDRLGVDLLSLTGHKFYAPKGIGALYRRANTPLIRQQDGGGQEFSLRAGTENVPYIVGLGQALKDAGENQVQEKNRITKLRDQLIKEVLSIPDVRLTGHPTKRAPHIASFVVEDAEGEAIILSLSAQGFAASSASACTSNRLSPSHVLTAMGIEPEISHGSIRFSLGKDSKDTDISHAVQALKKIVTQLRAMAPDLSDFEFNG